MKTKTTKKGGEARIIFSVIIMQALFLVLTGLTLVLT